MINSLIKEQFVILHLVISKQEEPLTLRIVLKESQERLMISLFVLSLFFTYRIK